MYNWYKGDIPETDDEMYDLLETDELDEVDICLEHLFSGECGEGCM